MITQEEVRQLFAYKDGKLFWKVPRQAIRVGAEAGVSRGDNGYRIVTVNQKSYHAHRLIFLYHFGFLPPMIDHIDRNPRNNRIENLRAADSRQNQYNTKRHVKNTSGERNVCWHKRKNKWIVHMCVAGRHIHIGYFTTKKSAVVAARAARQTHHKNFTYNGKR